MTFAGVDRARFEALRLLYPPEEPNLAWHTESFPPALIAAALAQPSLSEDEARSLYDEWVDGEGAALFQAALLSCDPSRIDHFQAVIATDGRLHEELSYCTSIGLEHCSFLRWCPDCQDKTLAFRRHERSRCSCGLLPHERNANPFGHVAWHEDCEGCRRLEMANADIPKGERDGPIWKRYLVTQADAERMIAELPEEEL